MAGSSRWKIWEALGIVIVIATVVGMAAVPMIGEEIFQPDDVIIVRMQTREAGGYDPDVIYAEKNTTIKILLRSMDVTHGFQVEYYMDEPVVVQPGKDKTIELTLDLEGEFRFVCTQYCSLEHVFMEGKLVVTDSG